jgi:hypothetical protein
VVFYGGPLPLLFLHGLQ